MDKKKNRYQESTDSSISMSESWNLIDRNDVNNISEGSDGESIEVIEEEGNNNSDGNDSNKGEDINKEIHSVQEDDTKIVNSSLLQFIESRVKADASSATERHGSRMRNAANIVILFALIAVVILGCAASWIVFVDLGKMALGVFHYFIPKMMYTTGRGNNIRFYNTEEEKVQRFVDVEHRMLTQRLQIRLGIYHEETNELKTMVADLSSAVESLKKELAFLKLNEKPERSSPAAEENHIIDEENILYQEILNIFPGKPSNESIFQEKFTSSFEDVSKVLQEMILSLTNGQEQESNMEVVKLFYRIPNHLSILNNFILSNQNTLVFIRAWREKLTFVNDKIVEDIRDMQLKMIKHFIKHMKCTQNKFYNMLCNVNGVRKQECYNTFIKPYEHIGICSSNNLGNFKEEKDVFDDINISKYICNHDSPSGKESSCIKKAKHTESQEKLTKKVVNIKVTDEIHEEETSNFKKQEELSDVDDLKKFSGQKAFQNLDDVYEKTHDEKGMDNDLTTDSSNNDPTNSFSSFSKGQGGETSSQGKTNFKSGKVRSKHKRKKELLQGKKKKLSRSEESDFNDGCWFLKIGSQRSKLRRNEARSNWLFDRANYRNTRKT